MKQRICIIILIVAIPFSSYTAGAASFNDVSRHWAAEYIEWAVNEGLAQGYKDGSFRPDDPVTEAEFLALMLRAYGVVTRKDELPADWSRSYYNHAEKLGWPIGFSNERGQFRRGHAALLIASAANGATYTDNSAIQWLLDSGISQGKTSATISGYDAGGGVKRAEALTFIFMMKEKVAALSNKSIAKTGASLHGVSLGDKTSELIYRMGQPSRIDPSDYDYEWYVYNHNYDAFAMFGVRNGSIAAMFSNDAGSWRNTGGASVDAKLSSLLGSLPAAVKNAAKQSEHYYDYRSNGIRHILFLDAQESNRIAGVLLQLDSLSPRPASSLGDKERTAMELTLFDIVNAERAQRNVALLQWDALAGSAARTHSVDMMKKKYFSHKSESGLTPFDRMKDLGIRYTLAAENIAAGYPNSLFAHYVLLNSKSGHRETILNGKLTRLGTGVAFGGSYGVYYTQDYFTP